VTTSQTVGASASMATASVAPSSASRHEVLSWRKPQDVPATRRDAEGKAVCGHR
jgi:hypothetical protein